jgi:hypothetical protein
MTRPGVDLKFPRPSARLRQGMQIAFEALSKWIGRLLHRIEMSTLHVEYHDTPSLDGMRWCDEVERKISQSSMGQRNWLDTCSHAGSKQIPR